MTAPSAAADTAGAGALPIPILVVGDSMLDRYWEGTVERISPEAPVPVLRVQRQFDRAGGAANVACNVAALGHPATLVTVVGDDDAGERLSALMAMRGIEMTALRDPHAPTTQKIRPVCRRQQLLRVDFEDLPQPATVQRLTAAATALLQAHRWALLSDYAKGSLRDCAQLIAAARRHGCNVLVDPKGSDFERYRGAFVLKPNADEVRAVVGAWHDEPDFLQRVHALRERIGVDHLLVTRGERGMTLCSAGRLCLNVAAQVREVYDVSGAGDTVLATLAHGLAHGLAMEPAVRQANLAAGIAVGKFGTASISLRELHGETAASAADGPGAATSATADGNTADVAAMGA